MNKNQVIDLLAIDASVTNRTVGETTIVTWSKLLADLSYDAGVEALLQHHKESTEWVKPAHILEMARRLGNERVERGNIDSDFRAEREQAIDARLASIVGSACALTALGEGNGTKSEWFSDQPPAPQKRHLLGTTDVDKVSHLGLDLTSVDIAQKVMDETGWEKRRAVAALGQLHATAIKPEPCGCPEGNCVHNSHRDWRSSRSSRRGR